MILAAAVAALVSAGAIAIWRAEHRAEVAEADAEQAEQVATQAQGEAATSIAKAAAVKAVDRETVKILERARRIERDSAPIIQEIATHAAADQPVDPVFARDWVAGLKRMCDAADKAGAGGCAPTIADRPGPGGDVEPVPARALAGR